MKLDALDHPKLFDFAARLGVPRPTAIGHLELLWAFTGKQSAQGNVGKWPDGAIARACDWMDSPEVFINSLVDSGFLDRDQSYRLTVHDWSDHSPGWVRAKLKKIGLDFLSSERSSDCSSERSLESSSDPPNEMLEASLDASKHTSEPSTRAPVPSLGKGSVVKGREVRRETASPAAPARPAKRSGLAHRIPDDFELTDERRLVAEAETLPAERTFAKFVDYWRAAGGANARKRDWDATWRNWCRADADRAKTPSDNGKAKPATTPIRLKTAEEWEEIERARGEHVAN